AKPFGAGATDPAAGSRHQRHLRVDPAHRILPALLDPARLSHSRRRPGSTYKPTRLRRLSGSRLSPGLRSLYIVRNIEPMERRLHIHVIHENNAWLEPLATALDAE